MAREGWILIGFVALALAAIVVSAAGWILFVRDRRERKATRSDQEERAGAR